jgi:hypothetical protein
MDGVGEMGNIGRILVRELKGKKWLGRPRQRWYDTIKMDICVPMCVVM